MSYQVLARKYRPLRFSDVVGQDHVTRTLLNALAQNRIAHGYIFSGHRGIGKTTIARILASALNCRNAIGSELRPTPEPCNVCESCLEIRQGNATDVIEIDAATNRGIDEIRELRDAARYRPSRDRFKIYILDEAHQITDAAFNALLKTLEEPPEHIVFMMATTQPEDIPQTIRSRCQHFSFHAVKLDDIMGQLRAIATAENIDASDETLALLAEAGDGSMRDALSIMDQAIASAPLEAADADGQPARPHLSPDEVRELTGTVSNTAYEQILTAVHANSSADVLEIVNRLLDAGNGPQQLARQFVRFLRNCIMAKITALQPDTEATGLAADLLQISPEERQRAARTAALFSEEELTRFLAILLRTFDELGYRQEQRFHLELGLLKLVHAQRLVPIEDILSQLGVQPGAQRSHPPASPQQSSASALPAAPRQVAAPAPRNTAGAVARPQPSAPPLTPSAAAISTVPLASTARSSPSTDGALAISTDGISAPHLHSRSRSEPPSTEPRPAPATDGPRLITPQVAPAPSPERPAIEMSPTEVQPAEPNAQADPSTSPDLTALHASLVAALAAAKGQQSASEQMEEARLQLNGAALEVRTTLSRTMLPVVLNEQAETILKATLRDQGLAHLKLKLLPGEAPAGIQSAAPAKPRPAAKGSAQELAASHPVVQQAQRLFGAEIRNVVDLRKP